MYSYTVIANLRAFIPHDSAQPSIDKKSKHSAVYPIKHSFSYSKLVVVHTHGE